MPASVCLCVAGWHFRPDVFDALERIRAAFGADVFVVSHRPLGDVPAQVAARVGAERVLVRPNVGYDWGCYQQFLDTGAWRGYDHVFFLHDDIVIRDIGFVPACIERLATGARFVGNGRNAAKTDWPTTHAHCYAHAAVRPPGPGFRHATVRGSFLATTRPALAELGGFEVFWDPFHLTDRFGNWSVVASSGRMAVRFGPDRLAFLSDAYLESDYLVELVRGTADQDQPAGDLPAPRRVPFAVQVKLSRWFMRWWWSARSGRLRSAALAGLGAVLAVNASPRLGRGSGGLDADWRPPAAAV